MRTRIRAIIGLSSGLPSRPASPSPRPRRPSPASASATELEDAPAVRPPLVTQARRICPCGCASSTPSVDSGTLRARTDAGVWAADRAWGKHERTCRTRTAGLAGHRERRQPTEVRLRRGRDPGRAAAGHPAAPRRPDPGSGQRAPARREPGGTGTTATGRTRERADPLPADGVRRRRDPGPGRWASLTELVRLTGEPPTAPGRLDRRAPGRARPRRSAAGLRRSAPRTGLPGSGRWPLRSSRTAAEPPGRLAVLQATARSCRTGVRGSAGRTPGPGHADDPVRRREGPDRGRAEPPDVRRRVGGVGLQLRPLGRRRRLQRRSRLQRRPRSRTGRVRDPRARRPGAGALARPAARPGRPAAAGRWWRSWTPG